MNTVDIYSKTLGASWAASEITAPFLFVPCSIALNAAMNGVALPVVSNIPGAALVVVAPTDSVSGKEGFYTGDGVTGAALDTSYAHPGSAALDDPAHGLYDLFNIFKGAAAGLNGRITLLRWRGAPENNAGTGRVVGFGTNAINSQHGWAITWMGNATRTVALGMTDGAANAPIINQELIPAQTYDTVEREYAILLNFKTGNIRGWVNNGELTPGGEAAILAAANSQTDPTCGVTLFGGGAGTTAGARTPAVVMAGYARDYLTMDLTNYAGDIEAEAPALMDALYRAPRYGLPRYMGCY